MLERSAVVVGCLSALLVVLAAPGALAQSAQAPGDTVPRREDAPSRVIPPLHTFYRVGVAARANPTGLFTQLSFQVRYRLYESPSLALKDNFIGVGPVAFVSPAFVRGGIGVELQPLSVLNLSASYEGTRWFGNFNYLQSFPGPNADASDRRLAELGGEGGTSYTSSGTLLTLAAMLQFKVGPLAVRSNPRLVRFDLRLREGDRVFYEPVLDVVVPNGGWVASNDADLLYVAGRLAVGLRYTATGSFFRPRDYPAGEMDLGLNPTIHRVGPFLAYTFHDEVDRRFNAPTLVLVSQWFLSHRYRTGMEVSQALPWIALAFQFKGIP
ncbi:hypothetical protein JRI60_13265 [Archangium violaceum]|uniref:hypothetical protein n=1 Tax=Archangium violaceum TaxID=83451 RepID=UPI0019520783|nr:hypothetical protein [Archangium violaceum]QRN99924.1 hypothetical protein JRI60_13265 [Archangium violaceum]